MSFWYRTRHQYELPDEDDLAPNEDEGNGENERLPRTHAELDALAEARDHEWSADGLTVAAKQAELADG